MDHFFHSIYSVIKCVKTKRVLKRKFASSVFQNCMQRRKKTQICVTGPQCVKEEFGNIFGLSVRACEGCVLWYTVRAHTDPQAR
jgi:stalled ribosome rescue protein Dom34